jgi:hypothetical protein
VKDQAVMLYEAETAKPKAVMLPGCSTIYVCAQCDRKLFPGAIPIWKHNAHIAIFLFFARAKARCRRMFSLEVADLPRCFLPACDVLPHDGFALTEEELVRAK